MKPRRLSPDAYRRITLMALMALGFIVVTGGAVRLSGSGLGCPDWPTCSNQRVVAPWEYHAMVEFVNRVITGIVSVAVILAVLGSLLRTPRRRDLTWLSLGLVAGVIGQIVLGGLTVLFELKPQFVMSHFLVSMVLVADAVILHERAGRDDGPRIRVGGGDLRLLARLVVASAAVVLVLGTVVTSSGPHGGDPEAQRFGYPLAEVARAHGIAVTVLLVLTLLVMRSVLRCGAPSACIRRGELLLVVLVAQAGVGYAQYFTGVPAALVAIHIAGASLTWVTALRFQLGLSVDAGDDGRFPSAMAEAATV